MFNHRTIAHLFSIQAAKVPEKIALELNDDQLSYRQLDERSDQLAQYLSDKGAKKGACIPICLNRSFEMIIAILGVIKTGAAYVPIDPLYPAERINYMLNDIQAPFILSNKVSCSKLHGDVILLDDATVVADTVFTFETATPSDLLYIIYTSGSTGTPKGVMVENKSLESYIAAQTSYFQITKNEKILQFSNYCFDASIEQIFLALLNGACLVLMEEGLLKDINLFSSYLREKEITHLHATPGFLENLQAETFPQLRRIVSAGDLCKKQLFKKWLGKVDFYNKYGPTEATISAVEFHCPQEGLEQLKVLPIGKPIAGNMVYLLNEQLQQVRDGEIGEICIAGIQVARGYLNLPELTSEKFIENPFSAGERLYRTGDLGRTLSDGNIEFLGRTDDQVKIRGYRIELGEIENTLRDAPGVKQCVVIADKEYAHGTRLVAYVVPGQGFEKERVKDYILSKLPEYMVPQFFVELDSIPLNANAKVDRKSLPLPDASALLSTEFVSAKHSTEKLLSEIWKSLLLVERVGIDDNFFELGGNSLLAQKLVTTLRTHQIHLPVTKLYSSPTVGGIAAFLDGRTVKPDIKKSGHSGTRAGDIDVAVIGMSGRFPGADDIASFWENLKSGREGISFFENEELDPSVSASLKNNPDYVKARGIINNPEYFDPFFFGINARQAELMDPQQRIFLEVSWEALESSGHIPGKYEGTIGVFAGCRFNTYYSNNVSTNKDRIENVGSFQVGTVSDKDYIASRAAYALDLKGPAVNVQSACSTSLLAIAQAVEAIRNGQCDVALAGGSSILVPVKSGHLYEEGAILSRDGHCRTFDDDATGTVFSDGAGVVVLKSKRLAEQDGDTIFAVVKGVGLSNDGAGKSSFTAPSAEGQARAISMALQDAAIDPADVSYIEAHGTATPIGDPIEIEGLNLAFGEQTKKQYCAIGSVKSNLGHLTAASGVVGFIKTCLALHYKQIPPTLHFKQPNRHIDFSDSPFYVNDVLQPWESNQTRIAGVSSFGVGGTNVHVVVEEAKQIPKQTGSSRPVQLLCWSAKEQESVDVYGKNLLTYISENKGVNLPDISYTLKTSRKEFDIRRFCIASDAQEFSDRYQDQPWVKNTRKKKKGQVRDVVFMFPGQGAQYLRMGKDLYALESVFKAAMDEVTAIFSAETGENLLDVIYPTIENSEAEDLLRNTRYSQPALFCVGYALAKLWMSWGIYPAAFVGHSIGEFVAAYFAGVFSLRDAVRLIATRGKMMSELPAGKMLSVRASYKIIEPFLSLEISLAAENSPNLYVLAGGANAIDALSDQLNAQGVLNRLLSTSHAFHSHMMDPVVGPFKAVVAGIQLNQPVIPILSTVTGNWLKAEEATDPAYWAGHLRSTVKFAPAIQQLLEASYDVFLEVGPGNTTATLTRQQAGKTPLTVLTSLGRDAEDKSSYHYLLNSLGELWINGVDPDWAAFYKAEARARINDLPTYAFNKKRYWVNPVQLQQPEQTSYPDAKSDFIQDHTSIYMRKNLLITQVKEILENASGIELAGVPSDMTFIEMGLDSLLLTQVALILKKQFAVPITFRQLNEEYGTLDLLATYLIQKLAEETSEPVLPQNIPAVQQTFTNMPQYSNQASTGQSGNGAAIDLISQQLQLLAKQLSLLQGAQITVAQPSLQIPGHSSTDLPKAAEPVKEKVATLDPTAQLSVEEQIEIKKPFGAAARIEKQSATLNDTQQAYLADLIVRYNAKTRKSKEYTQTNRAHMADPRVVSGFKPATKELVYSVVINKSKGSRLWDIDGNEYIDALNGFGSNMLGYQPDFIKKALIDQIEQGYEIGPQHELSGEVSKLIAEFTSFDRVALCNTGSEAVMGAMRIARTVTGRSTIVAFTGSYHGIADEVIVRGSKKMKTFPAAPGILHDAVQNMLILDYGTAESLKIIEERSSEIAAVLVEPIQSRRADFQPVDFLKKLRKITSDAETVLIFDEVISGFRFHPGGVQAIFGIKADIGTYGKVAGGGISIGIIAGKKKYMDALDGGFWQYGDYSIPEVGVTYFAGTFVRHPLALATAKASLLYLKEAGPQLQESLNANGNYIANVINAMCARLHVPMFIAQFGSLWRIKFIEEYPYAELFFTLMRLKGIHILEGFACFLTTAHSSADIEQIIRCFEESIVELKAVGLIPHYEHPAKLADGPADFMNTMPAPNARLGKDKSGNPAWFINDESNPGKYLQVSL
jgi:amino acid adenylation domain-containing protein